MAVTITSADGTTNTICGGGGGSSTGGASLPEGIHSIKPQSNNLSLGNVSGGGLVFNNVMTSVSAHPIGVNSFSGWKENNKIVSNNSTYSFLATKDRNLTAEFLEATLFSWSNYTMPESADWTSVAYGNGTFVAVHDQTDKAYYSTTNGKTWQSSTLPNSDRWIWVAYGGNVFVVIALSGGTAYSTDYGRTWKAGSGASGSNFRHIAYGDGVFIAVSTSNKNFISKDYGKTWQELSIPLEPLSSIAYGTYNGVGRFLTCRNGICVYSTNKGVSWNTSDIPGSVDCRLMAYGNGVFVALEGSQGTAVAYSTDGGASWQMSQLPETGNWYNVIYGGGVFVAIKNYSNKFAYSTDDGKTWKLDTLTSNDPNCAECNGNDTFVVVGYSSNQAAVGVMDKSLLT